MGKFDGYLICTDLDGTFTVGHDICADNAEYVKYFQDNGGLFTISTGRLHTRLSAFENFTPNCPVISHNGAVIYDLQKKEFLYRSKINRDVSKILDYTFGCDGIKKIWVHTDCEGYEINSKDDITDTDNIYKIVTDSETPDKASELKNKLNDKFGNEFCIFLAWNTGVEILEKNTNKGTAVRRLRELLGDKIKRTICVGDSESDAFMMREADIGYAVANADTVARAAADRITVHYQQGAISEIIKDLEKETAGEK